MFDIGVLELFIIAVIALLVLGPDRLPKAAQQAGRWIGRGKQIMSQWSDEINRQVENEELRTQLKEQTALKQLDSEVSSINKSLSQSLSGNSFSNKDRTVTSTPITNDSKPEENKLSA